MTSQERKASFQYIDKIYEDNGIIAADYKPISKDDVGSTVKIIMGDDSQKENKKKKTKQMTL